MTHMLTIKDLKTLPNGDTFYTGPLDDAKEFIRKECAVTESTFTRGGNKLHGVYLCIDNGEIATPNNCNDFGVGDTSEEAWRFVLGAEFGPADDEFTAFPLTHNKAEAVRVLVDHHFPARTDVFWSTTTTHAVVMDDDGNLWQVFPDGTLKVYRS